MSGKLKKSLACHCLVLSTLGSVLLNTGSCLCSYKGTYTYKQEPPSHNPWVLSVLHIGHLEQVTNLGVSNIKRCLAYFQSFIERCLPHRWTTLRGVHRNWGDAYLVSVSTWFHYVLGTDQFFFRRGLEGLENFETNCLQRLKHGKNLYGNKKVFAARRINQKKMLASGAAYKQMFACKNFPHPSPPTHTHTHPAPVENNGPSFLVVLIVCSVRTQSQ